MENIEIDIDNLNEVNNIDNVNVKSLDEIKEERKPEPIIEKEVNAEPGSEVVGRIKSSLFGGFTKILSFLSQGTGSQDIIYIKEGKLNLVKNAGFIYCDLSIMFNDNNIELVDPSKSIKLLNLIKGGDEVIFIKDDNNSRYLISNLIEDKVSTTITLPQPDSTFTSDIQAPELGEIKTTVNIDVDNVDNIQNAVKTLEAQYLKLELDSDNNIVSISTSDDIFKHEFIETSKETTIYKMFNPFPISKPDELFFEIHENDGQKWIRTISHTGMVNIEYMELIEEFGEFDSFTL